MVMIQRYEVILTVLVLQGWCAVTVKPEENQLTRHSGHRRHDKTKTRWDEWTQWTECSVACGKGIQTRSRDCRSMLDGQVKDDCIGRKEETRICQQTGCLREADDNEECKKLEARVFGGKRYRWIPYKHPRDECKLACRPVGAGFYIELDKALSDGTTCGEAEDRACISGVCKRVGCDNIVDSGATIDDCGVCGGDSTTCRKVSKTFTDSVKFGYHTIETIPKGATKIMISEAKGARNYLGVRATDKSFSINTDFRLSRFGNIPGAGTIFKYKRQDGPDCPDECIRADGPIDVAVEIIVLFYSDNSGITYSYNVPSDVVNYPDNEGEAQPVVHINGGSIPGTIADEDTRIRDDRKRPIFSSDFKFKKNGRRRKPRPHRNHNRNRENENKNSDTVNITGETGALQTHKTKTQTIGNHDKSNDKTKFDIYYKNGSIVIEARKTNNSARMHGNNQDQTNILSTKNDNFDPTDSFIEQKGDNADHKNKKDHNGIAEDDFGGSAYITQHEDEQEKDINEPDNQNTTNKDSQGNSTQSPTPENNVTDADMYTNDNRELSPYSWLISGYTECSQTCGKGKQSPVLECIVTDKRARVDDSFCSDLDRPSTAVLECSNGICPPSWVSRLWSKCSVSCGLGTQSRDYMCKGSDGGEVAESKCEGQKPSREERTCDLGSCAYGWYFTEWEEECHAHCGYGTLNRRVHCSSDSGNKNTACNLQDKPEQTKSCRNDDCGGFWVTGPWSKCNGTCGLAYQTRSVACAQKQRDRISIVSDNGCQDEEKPATFMSCDLEPCDPQWYMTDWGDCAVTCGTGQRSRDVRCLDDNFMPSTDCDKNNKPVEREQCSSNRPCPLSDESRDKPDETTKAPVVVVKEEKEEKEEIPANCKNRFPQCGMVKKAGLCKYNYYQINCCIVCSLNKKS